MLLVEEKTGDLFRILEVEKLWDPFEEQILGRNQAGEEEQPPMAIDKRRLKFPSGEPLPKCWLQSQFEKPEVVS